MAVDDGASGSVATTASTGPERVSGFIQAVVLTGICFTFYWFHLMWTTKTNWALSVFSHSGAHHLVSNSLMLVVLGLFSGRWTGPVWLLGGLLTNIVWVLTGQPEATGSSSAMMAVAGLATIRLGFPRGVAVLLVAGCVLAGAPNALLAHGLGLGIGLASGLILRWTGKLPS